jgi:hypothetical protein
MMLPNFLVIGAARSGSTALFDYLSQHPDVYTSDPKEPHFFALRGTRPSFRGPGDDVMMNRVAVTDEEEYKALFRNTRGARAVGEGSISYLYYPCSAENIQRTLPDIRLICILRNPADRAYSAFQYTRARTFEPLRDFRQALAQEEERIDAGWHHIWHYRRMGRYHEQLRRFYHVFDPKQIRVYRFEDLIRDSQAVLRDCFEFLDVDPTFQPPRKPVAVPSGEPRSRVLQRFLLESPPGKQTVRRIIPGEARRWLSGRIRKATLKKAPLDPDLRRELLEDYRDEIEALKDLTGQPFTEWLRS